MAASDSCRKNVHLARVARKESQKRARKTFANSTVLPTSSLGANHQAHKSVGIKQKQRHLALQVYPVSLFKGLLSA